jgi:hypothetical protein
MSVSFGSYEGQHPYENGRDPEYGHEPPQGQGMTQRRNGAAPGPPPAPARASSGLAVNEITDWRLAVDERGRPIPPPPGYGSAPTLPGHLPAPAPPSGYASAPAPLSGRTPTPSQPSASHPSAPLPLDDGPAAIPPAAAWPDYGDAAWQHPGGAAWSDHADAAWAGLGNSAGQDPAGAAAGRGHGIPTGQDHGGPAWPQSSGPVWPEHAVGPGGAAVPDVVGIPDGAAPVPSEAEPAFPSVSLPAGAFVPASVPVADPGSGLTALDDGSPGLDARPAAFAVRPVDLRTSPVAWPEPGRPRRPDALPGYLTDPSRSDPFRTDPYDTDQRHEARDQRVEPARWDQPPPRRPEGPSPSWDVVVDRPAAAGRPARVAVAAGPAASPARPVAALPPVLADLAAAAAAAVQAMSAAREATNIAVGAPAGPVPLAPYRSPLRISSADLAARHAVLREQVDYALAEIALAKAAFRRACEEAGRPGWPFRDTELDLLRRPAVAGALARELAGIERLRAWAQELYWLQEQDRAF